MNSKWTLTLVIGTKPAIEMEVFADLYKYPKKWWEQDSYIRQWACPKNLGFCKKCSSSKHVKTLGLYSPIFGGRFVIPLPEKCSNPWDLHAIFWKAVQGWPLTTRKTSKNGGLQPEAMSFTNAMQTLATNSTRTGIWVLSTLHQQAQPGALGSAFSARYRLKK